MVTEHQEGIGSHHLLVYQKLYYLMISTILFQSNSFDVYMQLRMFWKSTLWSIIENHQMKLA